MWALFNILGAIKSHCLQQELCLAKTKEVLNRDRNNFAQHQSFPVHQPCPCCTTWADPVLWKGLKPVAVELKVESWTKEGNHCSQWVWFSPCWLLRYVPNLRKEKKKEVIDSNKKIIIWKSLIAGIIYINVAFNQAGRVPSPHSNHLRKRGRLSSLQFQFWKGKLR